MAASPKRATVLRRLGWLAVGSMLALSALSSSAGSVLAASGDIQTTRGSCDDPNPQNENSYMVYETVSIRGSGFDPGTYDWDITATGKGGATVASGSFNVSSTGDFCAASHVIQPSEEGSEYQVTFGGKHDNYSVKGTAATQNPTQAPTSAPTGGGAGATLPPTDSVTGNVTSADNLGIVLMLLAGLLASVMVLTPARARKR